VFDGRLEFRPAERREDSADAGGQNKLRGPLEEPAVLSQTRDVFEKGAQSDRVSTRTLDGAILFG